MRSAKVVSIIIGVIVLGLAGWIAYVLLGEREVSQAPVTDFASCVSAGNPVTQTSPRQCRVPDGTTYAEPTTPTNDGVNTATREFTSPKGVTVRLHDWTERQVISSPLVLAGEIPGSWSFEASFPVLLLDPARKTIGQAVAGLEGDWMTDNYVPFSSTLTFEAPSAGGSGVLVLRKDNPSGLPENDDEIEIPITFSTATQ
ncbi:hypothetical protein D3C85_371620 [compost metagenome]